MKKTKIVGLFLLCILVLGTLAGCAKVDKSDSGKVDTNINGEADKGITDSGKDVVTELKGTIRMAGSTSMEKLSRASVEVFMSKYPNVTISPEFIGSSAGVEGVLAGTLDIGNASRNLKDNEMGAGAVENIVALDGIAIITDKANTIDNLTQEQLVQIYIGEINNWSAVGGADQPIVVIGREAGSGTRGAFEELLKIEDIARYANEINSTGGVLAKVASTPGSIGYVSLDVLNEDVIALKVNDVAPTEENIIAGEYILSRPFVMATMGEISVQDELVQAYFEFLKSEEGLDVIRTVGLITVE